MALESLPKIAPALFSAEQDLLEIYNKKSDTRGTINPSYIKSNPSGTAGAIQFSDGSAFASDGANLFWDNVNKRLGINNNAPTNPVSVGGVGTNGSINFNRTSDGSNQGYIGTLGTGITLNGGTSFIYMGTTNTNAIGTSPLTTLGAMWGIRGSGSTSATSSLLVQNSAGQQSMSVLDDGSCTIGINGATTNSLTIVGNSGIQAIIGNTFFQSPQGIFRYGGGLLNFYGGNNDGIGFNFTFLNAQLSANVNSAMVNLSGTYLNQQSFQFANLRIAPAYDFNANTTSAAIARGIYYNPTITNLRVAQHYAWQNTSGAMIVNSATPQASAVLQADSTTQGFLPPRVTTIQKNAIVTPANGLMVFDTDLGRPCFYNGAWVTL